MSGKRIAMWSGPRNISTAMMRAWENRPDAAVIDEPLYAFFLEETGIDHPLREETLAAGDTDWRRVTSALTGPIPRGRSIWYQKQMTHHLLPVVERTWIRELTNCFLIRDPREVLLSYAKKRAGATVDDVGVVRQAEIFDWVCEETGVVPPVLDARDVLEDPRVALTALCNAVGVPFDERMLSWPAGRRDTDGVWGRHWYGSVVASTGFSAWQPRDGSLSPDLQKVLDACRAPYARLREHRMRF